MMDHSRHALNANQTEEVLLEWHMPAWKQRLLRYRPYLIAVAALAPYAALGMRHQDLWVSTILLLLALGGIRISSSISRRVVRATTVGLTCTGQGVHIATMYPSTMLLLWTWLRSMECGEHGSLVITHKFDPGTTSILVPKDVREGLMPIVREQSTARIIGFD
jgi:hypothetical protein